MEDVKWLLRKCGIPILLLMFFVMAGVICWGKLHTEEQKVVEEVWEPPVQIENSEGERDEDKDSETSMESAYCDVMDENENIICFMNEKYSA